MSQGNYGRGQASGIEAMKIASKVKSHQDEVYADIDFAEWDKIRDSTVRYYDEDWAEAIIEICQLGKNTGLPVRYFPQLWDDICNIRTMQDNRRTRHAKGDISSYGYMLGEKKSKGEPVWELSDKWFTFHADGGGSGLIEGPRGAGKTLLATQSIALPYINTFRHVVSGIYVEDIQSRILDKPFDYYHYNSKMSSQLITALQIKIDALEKQRDEHKGDKPLLYQHPLVFDLIDEASMVRGKYRTTSDKTMQQMYISAIARHIGIFVWEVHPFDDTVIWVRETLTHKYSFESRGKLKAIVKVSGQKEPKVKDIWGFKSLEKRVLEGDEYVKYRPHAPVSYTVDVDIIAMLDHFNSEMELQLESGKKPDEIEEWRENIKWLKQDKESKLDAQFQLSLGNVTTSIAMFMVKLEEYNKLHGKSDRRYQPIKVAQNLVEIIMEDSPFPVKRGTLGEQIAKVRKMLKTHAFKEMERAEIEKEIFERLRQQGVPIDTEGNYTGDA